MQTRIRRVIPYVVFFVIACVMLIALPASAQMPKEGRDYTVVSRSARGIRVHISEHANLYTPAFAAAFQTTPQDIRADNPTHTLALCKRVGDGYHWALHPRSNSVKDIIAARASDAIWKGCPEKLQYTYIIPGETLTLTGVHHLTFGEKMQVVHNLQSAGCKANPACVNTQLAKLGVKVKVGTLSTAPSAPTPTPRIGSSSPIPVVAPPSTLAASSVSVRKESHTRSWIQLFWIAAFLLVLIGIVIGGFYVWHTVLALKHRIRELKDCLDDDPKQPIVDRSQQYMLRLQNTVADQATRALSLENALNAVRMTVRTHARQLGVSYTPDTTVGEILQRVSEHARRKLDVLHREGLCDDEAPSRRRDAVKVIAEETAKKRLAVLEAKEAYIRRAWSDIERRRKEIEESHSDLVDTQTELKHREIVVQGLFAELLDAAGLPKEMSLEEIEGRGGVTGIVADCVVHVRTANQQVERARADVHSLSEDLAMERRSHEVTRSQLVKRRLSPPPPPADLAALLLTSGADMHTTSEMEADGEASSRGIAALRRAVLDMGKIDVIDVDSVEELVAWHHLTRVQFRADPLRLCEEDGHVPRPVRKLLALPKVLNRLENLRMCDLGFWVENFAQHAPPLARLSRTLLPSGGVAPPANGSGLSD